MKVEMSLNDRINTLMAGLAIAFGWLVIAGLLYRWERANVMSRDFSNSIERELSFEMNYAFLLTIVLVLLVISLILHVIYYPLWIARSREKQ